jgi:hypothetical protein
LPWEVSWGLPAIESTVRRSLLRRFSIPTESCWVVGSLPAWRAAVTEVTRSIVVKEVVKRRQESNLH